MYAFSNAPDSISPEKTPLRRSLQFPDTMPEREERKNERKENIKEWINKDRGGAKWELGMGREERKEIGGLFANLT